MIWVIVGVAAGLLLAAYVYYQFIVPFNELRESLKRLAAYDFRPVLLRSRLGVFREASAQVRRISELLQQLDRQIADEGAVDPPVFLRTPAGELLEPHHKV